ncbi:botulinum neurotoxin type D, BoNT/D [Salmonella phage 41]|nr:botulinum neurotoxin type D, BoNT/D [Salmonella phage 41]
MDFQNKVIMSAVVGDAWTERLTQLAKIHDSATGTLAQNMGQILCSLSQKVSWRSLIHEKYKTFVLIQVIIDANAYIPDFP